MNEFKNNNDKNKRCFKNNELHIFLRLIHQNGENLVTHTKMR